MRMARCALRQLRRLALGSLLQVASYAELVQCVNVSDGPGVERGAFFRRDSHILAVTVDARADGIGVIGPGGIVTFDA